VATGGEVRPFTGHTAPVDHLTFAPDGKRLLSLGRDKKILDWDLASERASAHRQLSFLGTYDQYALSPRGNVAASWGYQDETIRLWDVATGKERRSLGKFVNPTKEGFLGAMSFSPDDRLLATADKKRQQLRLWDVETGRERRVLKGLGGTILCVHFSPGGKKIAAGNAGIGPFPTIVVWDVADGESRVAFQSSGRVEILAFSPDGKMLASGSFLDRSLHLWDLTTGRELRPLAGAPPVYGLAFSPDGRWLAGAGADKDQKVHVWEVSTGLEVRSFRGHEGGGVMSVAFAPDGRALASGGCDSTVIVWDLTGRMKEGWLQGAKWTPPQLEHLWKDLASNDGSRIVQALWDLVASPEQSVPLLRQRIKPVRAADAQRVGKLIRDLDSEDFETRTKAMEELEKIAEGAEGMLRKKLAEKPSLEVRQRIRQVLEIPASAEQLRAIRAIQVLEYIGTAEAKECLQNLAQGVPEARVTTQAKEALKRLAK
jgi:WD40 repeat protein